MASSHGAGYSGGFVKARKYDLAATNIANMGTDFEKAVKEAAAGGEKAWIGAGEREGLQMWRIEKFQVVPWPRKEFGRFYSGDSYIILHTYRKNPSSEALLFTVSTCPRGTLPLALGKTRAARGCWPAAGSPPQPPMLLMAGWLLT